MCPQNYEKILCRRRGAQGHQDFNWKKDGPQFLCIRNGYDVFVKKTVLKDYFDHYGPGSTTGGWAHYSCKLILHLLGGEDGALALKRAQRNIGVEGLLQESTILAVIGK